MWPKKPSNQPRAGVVHSSSSGPNRPSEFWRKVRHAYAEASTSTRYATAGVLLTATLLRPTIASQAVLRQGFRRYRSQTHSWSSPLLQSWRWLVNPLNPDLSKFGRTPLGTIACRTAALYAAYITRHDGKMDRKDSKVHWPAEQDLGRGSGYSARANRRSLFGPSDFETPRADRGKTRPRGWGPDEAKSSNFSS